MRVRAKSHRASEAVAAITAVPSVHHQEGVRKFNLMAHSLHHTPCTDTKKGEHMCPAPPPHKARVQGAPNMARINRRASRHVAPTRVWAVQCGDAVLTNAAGSKFKFKRRV